MNEQLKELKYDFDQWRKIKRSRSGKCPEDLKRKVISILEKVSKKELMMALDISSSTLYKWCQENKSISVDKKTKTASSFVPLTLSSSQVLEKNNSQLKLILNEKIVLELTHYSLSDVAILLSQLAKEMNLCCS
jgi:hypothetical protein